MLKELIPLWKDVNVCAVLILILMEHAQRVIPVDGYDVNFTGLNPYFNGTCSKR